MLNRTFAALSEPTRRTIVARLSEGEGIAVGELARSFTMSLPAVIKPLKILTDAGLITRTRTGWTVICRIAPEPVAEATRWLERNLAFWNGRLGVACIAGITYRSVDAS